MDNLDFSEGEIREQLAILGYEHIPDYRLREFKRDLDELIRCGDWKRMTTKCPPAATRPSPPAYTKEKVSLASFNDSGRGFFLHGGHTTPDRQFDSYARHSVAPKLHPLPGAPGRLPVEPYLDETIPSPLSESYTSTPDTRGRRFMRRKVLRKVEGRSVVCDESVYSGESGATMYRMFNDNNSGSSSVWSDGEEEEEEEEVEIERLVRDEDSVQVEEEPEVDEKNLSGGGGGGSSEEDDEDDACESPALSLMTSGYGTIRPEEPDGGDGRTERRLTEFDQDSRGDLSETQDEDEEEDERSLCSLGTFDVGPPACQLSVSTETDDDITGRRSGEVRDQEEEEQIPSENGAVGRALDEWRGAVGGGRSTFDESRWTDGEEEEPEEDERRESSHGEGVKFIDSRQEFSWMTYEQMCGGWEGNLRPKKDTTSVLGERLEALHLSSARREAELRDGDTHSDESDSLSRISFESRMTGMTGGQRDKPKSFIRPLIQSSRKTDPVAKYFHYKQFWEMFKPPGEADRSAVRQELKERLEYQPPPPKPRRVLVPNSYVIPTEKKRSALRWQVRNDLANGLVPYKFSCLC
ncbi:dentin sialophosphoprotein [Antennarius striatus]|uniref:dentin sialophosphoprotein n=1 Tax=Antennarius striatus TaxID=241820 RepID=UPI0035AF2F25